MLAVARGPQVRTATARAGRGGRPRRLGVGHVGGTVGNTAAVRLAVGAAFAARSRRMGHKGHKARPGTARRAVEEDPLLAEAKAAAEAARLQLEAAKLRAEAEELQKATAVAQRRERAVRLLGSEDMPGLGLPELMARLQETENLAVSGAQGLALAAALGFKEEPYFFRMEELCSEAFDQQLKAMRAQALKEEQAKQAEARRAEEARRVEAKEDPGSSSQMEINDDRSHLAYTAPSVAVFSNPPCVSCALQL